MSEHTNNRYATKEEVEEALKRVMEQYGEAMQMLADYDKGSIFMYRLTYQDEKENFKETKVFAEDEYSAKERFFEKYKRCVLLSITLEKDSSMIITYEHHGRKVSVQEKNKGKHTDNCLCHQGCVKFLPSSYFNCPIAQKLFVFDMEHGVVTPVWECPSFISGNSLQGGE